MPDLVEQMYCSQQIHIPPTFPFILKQYCKAAIRTQPYDLLRWSAAYFRCMANGEPPPVKPRLEYPQTEFPSGLSPGYLRVLLKQFSGRRFVGAHEVFRKWRGVSLNENTLAEIFMLGRFGAEIDTLKFIAICAAYLCEKLSRTMILLCELLTEEPEGGSAMIPCDIFINLYTYLARMNCGPVLEGENAQLPDDWAEYIGDEIGEEEQERMEEEVPEEEEEEEEREPQGDELPLTESEPKLTRCLSIEKPELEDMAGSIKNALWEALLAKLPDEEGEPDVDKHHLRDELWNSVIKHLEDKKSDEGGHSVVTDALEGILQSIPDLKTKSRRSIKHTPSALLKEAIWDAITEKKPPPSMKGTVWEMLSELITDAQKETMKNELWNAVVDRLPGDEISGEVSGEGSERPLKYLQRGEPESVPAWVGRIVPPYRVEVKGIGPVISEEQIKAVVDYMKYWAERQEDMVMPRNIRHFLCPPLDPPEDYEFEQKTEEEEDIDMNAEVGGEGGGIRAGSTPSVELRACVK